MEKQEYAYFKKQKMIKREREWNENYEKNFGPVAEYRENQRKQERKDRSWERKRKADRARQIRDGLIFGAITIIIGAASTAYANSIK